MGQIFCLTKSQFNEFPSCTKEDIISYCSSKSFIGLDIETSRKYPKNKYEEAIYSPGLDPYTSIICMVQIGDLDRQFVIDARTIDCSFLKEILENENILKIGHNLKFEGKHFFHNFKINIKNVWDTMIVERVLYNGEIQSYSLESLMKKYLGYENKTSDNLFTVSEIIEDEDENDLDFVEKKYVDKAIRKQFIDIGDRVFNTEEIEYGAKDITSPIEIYFIQKEGRNLPDGHYYPEKGINLENRFTQILAKIELKGIQVDRENWYNLYLKNKTFYNEKKELLNNWIEQFHPKFTQHNLFGENNCIIDWQSPKSVINFAKYLGMCPKEKSKTTGKIEYTVGAKAMYRLLSNENKERFFILENIPFTQKNDVQAFILNFLIFKKYQQLTTTFGEEWLRFIHPITKRVHTNFVQLMNTGRMSSRSPNLQQIPGGKEWRQLFFSNKALVATDYSAMEARIAADITGVVEMQQIFNGGHPIFGEDIHSMTATNMFRIIKSDPTFICDKKLNKKERNIAKAMLFKLLFGGSDFTIAMDLGVPLEEGKVFYDAFFAGNPGMLENFELAKKLAMQRGWIELDSTGKRYFFPHFNKMKDLSEKAWSYYPEDYRTYTPEAKQSFKESLKISNPELSLIWKEFMIYKGKLERAALNYRIQGNAATITKNAVLLLEENNDTMYGVLLMIHDELVEEWEENEAQERSLITLQKMKEAGKPFCRSVTLEAETAVGTYWIH